VNKLALARAYIENVTTGKLPRLEEFTNKQQFNRVITDLLTGITGIPKSQSEQLSVDLHKIQESADPISEFTTWFNNQPQQVQDLIIRAFPRYEFAKMLYELQQLPDLTLRRYWSLGHTMSAPKLGCKNLTKLCRTKLGRIAHSMP